MFTKIAKVAKPRKAKKTDSSKRFNGVILKMCFLGRPHLKNEGKKISKDIKNCRIFMRWISSPFSHFYIYKKRLFYVTFFRFSLLCSSIKTPKFKNDNIVQYLHEFIHWCFLTYLDSMLLSVTSSDTVQFQQFGACSYSFITQLM